jgi:TPR repeat protein
MKIRAAVLEEFGQPLVVQEVELAEPAPGETLIKLGYLTEDQMRQALCLQMNVPFLDLTRLHNEGAAFRAYLEAGEGGYGLAQRKLGELYDNGDGVQRDYQSSLKWYQKAREQGVPIPAPTVHSLPR